jgi:peptidoglycan/LPS O-acetylase OafA/YrhL
MDNTRKHLDFIDQIRGIAIVGVFLVHCLGTAVGYDQLPWVKGSWLPDFQVSKLFLFLLPLSLGWAGVAAFFVISGFCIHLSFARNPNWRNFSIRRCCRIYPAYFLAVLLFALLFPWSRIHWDLSGIAQLGSHLALIHNYDDRFYYGISPAFWSIAVEVQLYLLYPVLLWLVARMGWQRTLVYIAMLEIGLRTISSAVLVVSGASLPLSFSGLPLLYWYSWSIGAAIADAHLLGRKIPFANHSSIAWGAAAVGSNFLQPLTNFSFLFFALMTATVIAKLLQDDRLRRRLFPLFISRSLRQLGLWSYSIYLLHQPFIGLAPRIATKLSLPDLQPSLAIFTLSVCLWLPIVGISALWYRWIEIPMINIGQQQVARMSSTDLK